jgi:hypothetical protein
VAYGSKSPNQLRAGSKDLARVLTNAELRELPGQTHNVSVKKFAPVMAEFLARADTRKTTHEAAAA